jgi:ADP-heptose:LPS heptosyltransferase
VIVLRYDRLGDMVLFTGIIKRIARAQPTVAIDVLASEQNVHALEGSPYIGRILTINRRRPWSWVSALRSMRRTRYDAVIDVMVMAPSLTTMLVMWSSGARHRIGLGDRGNGAAFTLPVQRLGGAVHYIDHSAALLAAFGVDPRSDRKPTGDADDRLAVQIGSPLTGRRRSGGWGIWRPELFLTPAEIAHGEARWQHGRGHGPAPDRSLGRLVVNVSAGNAWRYWPEASFIEALRPLRSAFPGLDGLVIGAPHDAERMRTIGNGSGYAVAHTERVREMMAIVATSDVVFTADTAVTHIASAFLKPTLAMFARDKGKLWGPYDVPGGIVWTAGESLDLLDVAAVLPTLMEVIADALHAARECPGFAPERTASAAR